MKTFTSLLPKICLSALMKLKAVKDDFQDVFDALPNGPIQTAVKEIIVILKQDNIVGEHVKKKQIPKY